MFNFMPIRSHRSFFGKLLYTWSPKLYRLVRFFCSRYKTSHLVFCCCCWTSWGFCWHIFPVCWQCCWVAAQPSSLLTSPLPVFHPERAHSLHQLQSVLQKAIHTLPSLPVEGNTSTHSNDLGGSLCTCANMRMHMHTHYKVDLVELITPWWFAVLLHFRYPFQRLPAPGVEECCFSKHVVPV